MRSDRTHRGLDLDPDEGPVVVDIEQRLRGIGHAPDHLCRDLDGVAAQIVDLDHLGDDVVGASRDLALADPWPHPAQAGRAVGALIAPEQRQRRCLVRLQHVESLRDQNEEKPAKDCDGSSGGPYGSGRDNADNHDDQQQQEHEIAAEGLRHIFPIGIERRRRLAGHGSRTSWLTWPLRQRMDIAPADHHSAYRDDVGPSQMVCLGYVTKSLPARSR